MKIWPLIWCLNPHLKSEDHCGTFPTPPHTPCKSVVKTERGIFGFSEIRWLMTNVCHAGVSSLGFLTKCFLFGQQVSCCYSSYGISWSTQSNYCFGVGICVPQGDLVEKIQLSGVVVVHTERIAQGPHTSVQMCSLGEKERSIKIDVHAFKKVSK